MKDPVVTTQSELSMEGRSRQQEQPIAQSCMQAADSTGEGGGGAGEEEEEQEEEEAHESWAGDACCQCM
jgi:hypothetical protein